MELNEYQSRATKTAQYPDVGSNIIYPTLGLVGEAGEVAEKIKKAWRNYGASSNKTLHPNDRAAIIAELGDVLWYVARLGNELHADLNDIALANLLKLEDRLKREVIKSCGDNR